MAVDMFLKLDGVKGESTDSKHENEIEVLNWSWGAAQSGAGHTNTGSGAGKVSIQDLHFTHYVDKATPDLLKNCANGAHIKDGTLVIRKAGKDPLEYIKIKMENILVTSITPGGAGHDDRIVEGITLNFRKFTYTYTPQDNTGKPGSPAVFAWDIGKNVEA